MDDYDLERDVDGADFLAWQRALGATAEPPGAGADGDGSGTINAGDLTVWEDRFTSPAGVPTMAASTRGNLCGGSACQCRRRRVRGRRFTLLFSPDSTHPAASRRYSPARRSLD
jgi:hypothetical protein